MHCELSIFLEHAANSGKINVAAMRINMQTTHSKYLQLTCSSDPSNNSLHVPGTVFGVEVNLLSHHNKITVEHHVRPHFSGTSKTSTKMD